MKSITALILAAVVFSVLALPAAAFAGESEYARIGKNYNVSPSTSGRYDDSNQGSVETSKLKDMWARQQGWSPSAGRWVTYRYCWILPGKSGSSSYNGATNRYWRLELSGLAGYGVINAF